MKSRTIEIREAQFHLAELLDQADSGTEIILTLEDHPRARLVPIMPSTSQRVPGLHAGSMTTSPDFDAPLPDEFWAGDS